MHLESADNESAHIWGDRLMSFGERVRTLRTRQGLSAKDLSAKSGVPEKAIYRIETGEVQDPGIKTVEKLVQALSCSADELLFDTASFAGDQRLRRLFEVTAQTSKRNQDLVAQLITQLNMADALQWEVLRHQIEPMIGNPNVVRQSDRQPVTLEDLNLPEEAVEYFRKYPRAAEPTDDQK